MRDTIPYEERNDFQYVTNFIVTPDYYSNEESMKGYDRYQAIEKAINPDGSNVNGVVTADEAMDVLKMVGRRKWDKEQGKSDSNSITVWSALYNLTDRTVTWVSNEEYGNITISGNKVTITDPDVNFNDLMNENSAYVLVLHFGNEVIALPLNRDGWKKPGASWTEHSIKVDDRLLSDLVNKGTPPDSYVLRKARTLDDILGEDNQFGLKRY